MCSGLSVDKDLYSGVAAHFVLSASVLGDGAVDRGDLEVRGVMAKVLPRGREFLAVATPRCVELDDRDGVVVEEVLERRVIQLNLVGACVRDKGAQKDEGEHELQHRC